MPENQPTLPIAARTDNTLLNILIEVQARIPAETVVLVLAEDDGATGHYVEAMGKLADWLRGRRGPSATSGLSGEAFRSPGPVLVRNTVGDERVRQDHAQTLGITTALATALHTQNQLLGALMLLNKNGGGEFEL